MPIPATRLRKYEQWLLELTTIPTAAGREDRVIEWIDTWMKRRRNLRLEHDPAGNLIITNHRKSDRDPIYFTAHMDHPAFVVTEIAGDRDIILEFRGGVEDVYFTDARIELFDRHDMTHIAEITALDSAAKPFKRVTARLKKSTNRLRQGDVGRWVLPNHTKLPYVKKGMLYTHACDDLAAVAAALAALDELRNVRDASNVGVFLTRAEEIGFIGALAACRNRTLPESSRLICLENSRSFAESPIGAGPILRVGDKSSVFGPTLTNRIAMLMGEYAEKNADFQWQRKLMPGGTCESTAFSQFGYESTCLCLPLGNYHNMPRIDSAAGAGLASKGRRSRSAPAQARVGPEYISVRDFHGLIEMLVICGKRLDTGETDLRPRLDRLFDERRFVLEQPALRD